ncbi:hypothetical protein MsAg5_16210 [Methanosarcinaceae archaeon Ag5]|uniref:NurA domain-containing protein n=1 Tax=Methanolapillus africanus TaxID=3028297 RepID=A0AAE4MKX4_9EURY|nr:hypothetical protein [Methanosarcinaceae archaeon Ag5]
MNVHKNFEKTLEAVRSEKISLPPIPSPENLDSNNFFSSGYGKIEYDIITYENLDAKNGLEYYNSKIVLGYDESIQKYQALEGAAYFTSHSLIMLDPEEKDYIPSSFLTFYFYTRSKTILENSEYIKSVDTSSNPEDVSDFTNEQFESAYKKDYANDRSYLISKCPPNSILFVDGPLIGAQMSEYTVKMNHALLEKNIVPIFFIKNSSSNLVIDNVSELRSKFNSDMHWSYQFLKQGQRTNFFKYTDKTNSSFSKVFCYLKPFKNRSPQRVEIHTKTYEMYKNEIDSIMNLVYYFLLVHGDVNNPQVRPVAIAEMYARHTLNVFNIYEMVNSTKLTPTMNEVRGFK